MKELRYSSKFKKDYKRILNNPEKLKSLNKILLKLKFGEPIPQEYRPHKLTGQYKGCMECHVESDFLLIWQDESTGIIYLVRLGSHSELFR